MGVAEPAAGCIDISNHIAVREFSSEAAVESSTMQNIEQSRWYRYFPPGRSRTLPHARFWKIALRTIHLLAVAVLVGGHVFNAPAGQLEWLLYVAIVTGIGMAFFEAYPTPHFIFEGWALLVFIKLVLLCVIPFAWSYRVPLVLAVVAIGSVGSHMPSRFRHYSFLYRKVIKP